MVTLPFVSSLSLKSFITRISHDLALKFPRCHLEFGMDLSWSIVYAKVFGIFIIGNDVDTSLKDRADRCSVRGIDVHGSHAVGDIG